MAGASGTALFRSMVSTKMARAALLPHRVIATMRRGLHGGTSSGVGRSSPNPSRLSTSRASSSSAASSSEDLSARNQLVLRQARDHSADPEFMQGTQAQIKAATNACLTVLVFSPSLFSTFVKPRLNRLEDRADTLTREVFELKQEIIEMKSMKDEGHKAKIYEAQSMETSGTKST